LWLAAVDFKKAFDTIDHKGLWESLLDQKVPIAYVTLLQHLYCGQSGRVRTDKLSKSFDICRGTKQGDPLSSLLFNSLLEHIFRSIKPGWNQKRFGVQMGTGDQSRLSNLRFADDVLLVGTSQRQITMMLSDMHVAALRFGLQLHPEKTKIMTNTTRKSGRGTCTKATIEGMDVSILPLSGCVKYLGRQLCFENSHEVELQNRIRGGWVKFMTHKQELTSKHYALNDRLKLFDTVVSPTVLYAAGTWALTKRHEHTLQRTQRRMLRMILGAGRRPLPGNSTDTCKADSDDDVDSDVEKTSEAQVEAMDDEEVLEPWSEWIQRTTHRIEELALKVDVSSWVVLARRAKWKLAHRIAMQSTERWSQKVLTWEPFLCFDGQRSRAHRKQSRPNLRWIDDIRQFTQTCHGSFPWQQLACNAKGWFESMDLFCTGDWRGQTSMHE
jgi:hypothetical protein